MKRREFIMLLGGAVAAWPVVANAQERVRHIGVLMHSPASDREAQARVEAFLQGLQDLGWIVGRNVKIDYRWTVDITRLRYDAAELVALGPDILFAGVGATIPALLQSTRTIPMVFAQGIDPVGAGWVRSLSRPGGNATGFTQFEFSLSGKWLELLKEIAPRTTRVAVLREPGAAGVGQWAIIQAVAQTLGVELQPIELRDVDSISRDIAAFAAEPNGGLIVVVAALAQTHRDPIVSAAAQHQLPAIYPYRLFAAAGGLASYGPNLVQLYRSAAGYVDRILKGEKPTDLPVQASTKFELTINLKTAGALGLTIPPTLLARADEVIE
jgi:putative ABC transport system substrate-binding protein